MGTAEIAATHICIWICAFEVYGGLWLVNVSVHLLQLRDLAPVPVSICSICSCQLNDYVHVQHYSTYCAVLAVQCIQYM